MSTNNTITVNVTSAPTAPAPERLPTISTPDIEAEARLRIATEQAKIKAEKLVAEQKLQQETEIRTRLQRDELIKLKAQEMEIRIAAERLVMEAEAKRAVDDREAKIRAEMERLKSRTDAEILKEDMAFLQKEMSSLKEKLNCGSRS